MFGKSTAYGALQRDNSNNVHVDYESGNITVTHQTAPKENKRSLIGTIAAVIGVTALIFFAVLNQTRTTTSSNVISTNFAQRLSKGPVDDASMVPPPLLDLMPENNSPPTNEIPLVTPVTVKTSKKFGLNRAGYGFVSVDNDHLSYAALAPHTAIIEPHAENHLWVDSTDETLYHQFFVCSATDSSACYDGVYSTSSKVDNVPVTVPCTPGEVYTINYKTYSIATDEQVGDETAGTALCMYVRREIRTLTDDHLAKTMDAMYALWSTSEDEGVEKYGKNFKSASTLTNLHHFNAGMKDSDHIHEGNGFLLQHLKMTNMFEAAMQAVDPSVSLPYWDFTIDNSVGRLPFNSYIFTPSMFGSMSKPSDMTYGFGPAKDQVVSAAIPDGRWAFLKTEKTTKYADLQHPFGYVRAPWNMNPSPYISRYTADYRIGINLPGCTAHYNLLKSDDMMDFFYNSAFDSHSTTHALIGGVYGCELMKPLLEKGYINSEDDLKKICSKWVFNLKEFYRFDYIRPRTDCVVEDSNYNEAVCGFSCAEPYGTSFKNNIKAKLGTHVPSDISDEGLSAWSDFICTGDGYRIYAGDHLESASPADPSFWVIHPTLDRLFQAKLMTGGFQTEKWSHDVRNDFVCEKSKCYDSTVGAITYGSECCYGHTANDQLYDAISGSRSKKMGLTNAELLKISNPTSNYGMTYVYDSFNWQHCTEDFSSLLTNLKTELAAYRASN